METNNEKSEKSVIANLPEKTISKQSPQHPPPTRSHHSDVGGFTGQPQLGRQGRSQMHNDRVLRKSATALSCTSRSPQMYSSAPALFPPSGHTSNNVWTTHYPSIHPPPLPQQDHYHLPSVPGASFDSSGSHSNHVYARTTTPPHDYVPMLGGHIPPHNSPLPVPYYGGFATPQVLPHSMNSAYGTYPSSYGMYGASHVYPSSPSSNVWSMPAPPPHPQPIMLVYDITPSDVLCGRGGATNSHSGNRAFRSLVKKYQDGYLKAKKRDKPAVASLIVELVRKQGGRFLRRYERTAPNGQVLWVDIGDDRAREKTCQALRENAPEIRRRKKKRFKKQKTKVGSSSSSTASSCSLSDDDIDDLQEMTQQLTTVKDAKSPAAVSSMSIKAKDDGRTSPTECSGSSSSTALTMNGLNKETHGRRQLDTKKHANSKDRSRVNLVDQQDPSQDPCTFSPCSSSASSAASSHCGPILIRPITKLLPKQLWQVAQIPIDELDQMDRDCYLRDFMPPCPTSKSTNRGTHGSDKCFIEAKHYPDRNSSRQRHGNLGSKYGEEGAEQDTTLPLHPTPLNTSPPQVQSVQIVGV
ncbi:hypothetical protein ACA910_013641 [Epithemia clementina (nom. ined.)]